MDQNERFTFCLWERASTLCNNSLRFNSCGRDNCCLQVLPQQNREQHIKRRECCINQIHNNPWHIWIACDLLFRMCSSFLLVTPAGLFSQKSNSFIRPVALYNGEITALPWKTFVLCLASLGYHHCPGSLASSDTIILSTLL